MILNFPDVFGALQKLYLIGQADGKILDTSLMHDLFISIQFVRIFSSMFQEGEVKLEKSVITLKSLWMQKW